MAAAAAAAEKELSANRKRRIYICNGIYIV